jgi:uncharacterized protein (DUF302 family)
MMTLKRRGMVALVAAGIVAGTAAVAAGAGQAGNGDGLVAVRSAYPMAETVDRLKADIAAKGIMFFAEIDQQDLARGAGIALPPSTLLLFGNPPLGIQFLTANPESGIDWPVRVLVHEDGTGQVFAVYNDFGWIARRHHIADRDAQFTMASEVIASITGSVAAE